MNEYSTLTKLRSYLALASNNTSDDSNLESFLRRASRAIDKYTRRTFYPKRKTLFFDIPIDNRQLKFREDVLDVKGLSDINGASEIDTGAYYLKCGVSHNTTPYDRIILFADSGSLFNYSGTPEKAVHVDMILGYHEDYDNAWTDSGASLTADLASQITLASVSGSAGENTLGISPRFDTFQLWRIDGNTTSEEYALASAVSVGVGNDTASIIKLVRGINGTTATSHASGAKIETFEYEPDIELSVLELAAWLSDKSMSPHTNRISIPSMGMIEFPQAWPDTVRDRLDRFKKTKVYRGF